jgi:hypothetical protein
VSISDGIEPLISAYVRINKGEHDGKELMIVTVDEPDDAEPYYVRANDNSTFFYRRDNSTLRLQGDAITRYMEQVAQRRKRRRARFA